MIEIYLIFLFLTAASFLGLKAFAKSKSIEKGVHFDILDITIVIPFRNEEGNLPALIASLRQQLTLPAQIIFVNDHSTDLSEKVVLDFIAEHKFGQLLTLTDKIGKKEALALGIKNVQTNYVLTMDADVVLNERYFQALSELERVDFISLPVIMRHKGFLQGIFAIEFMFFNAFNFLFSSFKALTANGANLLFNVNALDYQVQLQSHHNIASGDDHYLLKAFQSKGVKTNISNLNSLSVITDSPVDWKAYFSQRVRWVGKNKYRTELLEVFLGFFFAIYFLGGFVLLIALLISGNYSLFLLIFILRLLIDSAVYVNYGSRLRINKGLVFLPFFQIIYPILFVITIVFSLLKKPSWKGRKSN